MDEKSFKQGRALIIGLVIFFLATLPAVFSNTDKVEQAKKDVQTVLDEASKICSSNCTEYPSDWVKENKKAEAELYCMRQCANDMEAIRNSLHEAPLIEFENQYQYWVAKLWCLLGFKCYAIEIEDFIQNYHP